MELTEKQQEKYNEIFLKYDCDEGQAEEIFLGIKKGLDISWYAKTEFDEDQMKQIRFGLEHKLDPTLYAYSDISTDKMEKIIKVLIEE